MKKIVTSILLSALILSGSTISKAQTTHPVELGFNVGASWLQSDVKMKKLGGAGGFTFGQMYRQNDKNVLDWGWRFRYLGATTYGQDTKKSTGIAFNPVLNGGYDAATNYNSNGGFVYQNYRTKIDELSLELVIGANKMRNNTKVYPYIFGGLGITKAATRTNVLDENGLRYNYASVDSNGIANNSHITSSLNSLYDGTYETAAEGSESPRWKFMPSLGVGLGYQFAPGFSMGLEHKMTWALHDGLDGQQWTNENTFSPTKDKYHYSSVWLKFSFGRGHHTTNTTVDNTVNNTTTNTNIVTPAGDKPSVVITNPSTNSYTSTSQSYTVRATIKNISSKSDIGLVYNGVSNTNFTYDATSQTFAFPLMLLNGANTFLITATNANGSTTDNATVLFESPVTTTTTASPAPVVTITSPTTNPYSTTSNNATVVASVLNVTSPSQIGVTINGVATSSFLFNATSHNLNVNSNLNPGANTFVITATNASGSDSKSITVIYSVAVQVPAPIVTIINPAVNPFNSTVASLPINALVQNVTSVGQVAVNINGSAISSSLLSFNPSTGQLNFNVNLINGANNLTVSATNASGADSKTITLIYTQPVVASPPPAVTIVNPAVNPFTSSVASLPINALVQHVTSIGQVAVTLNGGTLSPSVLSFNPSTGQLNFNANLINGANSLTVSATNAYGADSKTITIIYSQPVVTNPAPVVTITSPTVNPFNTTVASAVINASVLNVATASQITVSLNGTSTSAFTYNTSTKQLNYTASLIAGANIVTITAATAYGSDSKSETIIYTAPAAAPAPVVTITVPNTNPFNTSVNTVAITATVLNVTAASQIAVSINGIATSAFAYNLATKQLTLSPTLIVGANIVTITATTPSGSDSKSETIVYSLPTVNYPPIVTIASPSTNPYTSSSASLPINSSVKYVTSVGQIAVTLNGGPISASLLSFNASTSLLTFNVNLISGANTLTISATNATGSDSKTTTIMYSPVVVTPAPVVTITSPTVNPFNTSTASSTVTASVLNVSSSSQITTNVNGASVPFTYNMSTKQLSLSTTLIAGANVVTIAASTPSGADSKTTTIIYTAPVVLPAPVVTFTTPLAPGAGSTTATYNVEATVLNVSSASGITVKVNGVALTTFTFNALTKQVKFTATLITGSNTVTITATNTSGADTKSVVIKYRPTTIDVLHPDTTASTATKGVPNAHNGSVISKGGGESASVAGAPTVTFSLASPYNATTSPVNVMAVIGGITMKSDVVVKVNGAVVPFDFTVKTKTVSFDAVVNIGANIITITATNAAGVKTETLMINRP